MSAAIAFGVEAIQLRKDNEPERPWEEPGSKERSRRGRSSYTLPPSSEEPFDQWGAGTSGRADPYSSDGGREGYDSSSAGDDWSRWVLSPMSSSKWMYFVFTPSPLMFSFPLVSYQASITH